jgi:hypothetical protein
VAEGSRVAAQGNWGAAQGNWGACAFAPVGEKRPAVSKASLK